ncbi:SAM-dependent methyltransferase [Micromonospora sp. NPDC049060]|uniref:SAM-dependent methyltransferase n=1 Tax=Micromonospora sp. NPDC049060 TaxID=3154828 RepID=UPI0033DCF170
MSTEPAQSVERPSPARMYDYFLHGTNNYPVDRAAAEAVIGRVGQTLTRDVVWENRRFLGRAVRHLAEDCGIRQFIDVGAGLPSQENTHHVARRAVAQPRVIYVDNDPAVAEHGKRLLTEDERANTGIFTADLRDPGSILDHPDTKSLIDFSQPVGVLFIAVFHFVRDSEDPKGIIRAFRDRMAPGSYLALSHLCVEGGPDEERRMMEDSYRNATAPMVYRTAAQIADLFEGFELVAPGLVPTGRWRQDDPDATSTDRMYAGVARKL